jgi:hypothetical protein
MRFGGVGVDFTVLDRAPDPDLTSIAHVYCEAIHSVLSPGDTVKVKLHHSSAQESPAIIGRITNVANEPFAHEHIHPGSSPNSSLMLRVNWFMEKQDDSEWPSLASRQLRQTNITEVAITNCVVWISPSQIEDIVFVFHSQFCVDQNFGPVFGRKSCYFTHTNIIFPPHEQNCTVSTSFISSEEYSPFGYDTFSTRPHFTTFTERMHLKSQKYVLPRLSKFFAS